MADHVVNPSTKFEDPTAIRSWVISSDISHRIPCQCICSHCACAVSRNLCVAAAANFSHILEIPDPDLPILRSNFWGKGRPLCCIGNFCSQLSKATEPIAMLFELWTWVKTRRHVLDRGTLATPGEYDWTVRVCWRCSLMLHYLFFLHRRNIYRRNLLSPTEWCDLSVCLSVGLSH